MSKNVILMIETMMNLFGKGFLAALEMTDFSFK